jgi:uncharacterized membrane protein
MTQTSAMQAPDGQDRPARPRDTRNIGINGRLAAFTTKKIGSMWSVYITIAVVGSWIALATWGPLHRADAYPFPFLLFLGNLVQLCLVFIILVGQQVLGQATDERAAKTYDDAEVILREVSQLHDHLGEQDAILTQGISLVDSTPHPWITARQAVKPARVSDHHVGLNGRVAAWLTRMVGTMWAFYLAAIGQLLWIGLAQLNLLTFDAYPFAFLLFISSLLQLVFMFVIMVGQDVLGQAGDTRANQTFLDSEAILHECMRLQQHLTAQDKVIVSLCQYIEANAPKDSLVRLARGTGSKSTTGDEVSA